jgi:hypothetical protein
LFVLLTGLEEIVHFDFVNEAAICNGEPAVCVYVYANMVRLWQLGKRIPF